MSSIRPRIHILSALALPLLFAPPLYAQRATGGHPAGGIIEVQVRYADGRPGPRGIHVRLEAAEGGAEADAETIEGGKYVFSLARSGVFLVLLREQGYQEVSARVELISTTRGYVSLDLKPLPGTGPPNAEKEAPAGIVSTEELNVPDKAREEFSKGEEALKEQNPSKAAGHFQKAIKLYNNYAPAYRMLGEAYLEQQDWKNAEEALQKSIALDPKQAAAYVDLGAVQNQQGTYAEAEVSLKKGLEISPDATAAKYELAKTYMATNRWQEAAPLVQEVVKELPLLAGAHVLYGNILLKQRDGAGALREYKEYLRIEPGGTMATQVRAQVEKVERALGK
jgi:tetratricopeptide (TPR) repeat protein